MENKQTHFLQQGAKLGVTLLPLGIFVAAFEFALPLKLDNLEQSLTFIGVFIGASWILTTFLDFWFGSLIDRIGKKSAIALGTIIFAVSATGFALTGNVWLLFLCNLFAYLGFDILYIAIGGFLIESSEKRVFNYAASGFFSLWQVAYVIGPLLAAYLLLNRGYSFLYFLALPMSAFALMLFFSVFRGRNVKITPEKFTDLLYLKTLIRKEYIVLAGAFMCAFWNSTMIIGIPLLYAAGQEKMWHSAFLAVAFAAPFALIDLFAGVIANNRQHRLWIILSGFLMSGAALGGFTLTSYFPLEILFVSLSAIGVNLAWVTFEIEAGLISEKHSEGKTESCFMFAKNMGWDMSPFLFGILAQQFGIKTPFAVTGILLILFAALIFRRRAQLK